jgi:hypothetical protein
MDIRELFNQKLKDGIFFRIDLLSLWNRLTGKKEDKPRGKKRTRKSKSR